MRDFDPHMPSSGSGPGLRGRVVGTLAFDDRRDAGEESMINKLVSYFAQQLAKQLIESLALMDTKDIAISVLHIQPGDTLLLKQKINSRREHMTI